VLLAIYWPYTIFIYLLTYLLLPFPVGYPSGLLPGYGSPTHVHELRLEELMYTTGQNVSQVVWETRTPRNWPGDPVFIHNFVFCIRARWRFIC